jgi:hypothetical protein
MAQGVANSWSKLLTRRLGAKREAWWLPDRSPNPCPDTSDAWIIFLPQGALLMLEKDAATVIGQRLQDSQNCLAGILRAGNFSGEQLPVEMRLGGRMSRAKRALLFRHGCANGAADGQYLSSCRLPGFHSIIVYHRHSKRWSILLSLGESTA